MSTSPPTRATPSRDLDVGPGTLSALVVDDDIRIAAFLYDNLIADRFVVTHATSGEEALEIAMGERPDVAIIDVGLPGMSGFELVSAIREGNAEGAWDPGMAILMLTGRDDPQSVIRGIERGADDYLTKPVHYPELLARIGANIRRARGITLSGNVSVGPVEVDRRSLIVTVHGRGLRLSSKEFSLLSALARDPHRAMSKHELLREVWGYNHNARTRTLDSHASRLRTKLADAGVPGWIRNVWGQGYRLLPEEW